MKVATVPTVYGIETFTSPQKLEMNVLVATVPTVYGIETRSMFDIVYNVCDGCNSTYRLRY